ncbi:hypothetical protein V5N11_021845 [Cardamine amara subsp. amara]|uniref:Uncharacterized protein n=1 Tax=Cardamine amara subsp. amara TaxID=228776 RepID=A0ABD1B901_CARAN
MMDNNEQFVYNEVDYKTPKQSPQSNQTWPMDKIQQSRFQQKMSSLLSPVTPKRNCYSNNARSLLLQCLRDAKSDPLPRRRVPVTCSDEGILMDGVLVTSATAKKVSDSPSFSLGRAARSSIFRSQNKNTEFSSPRSESAHKQETTRSQKSSDGKGEMLASSPCTPKVANPSKLQASAEPFILTSRQASPFQHKQLPHDHYNPQFPNSLHLKPYPYFHRPRPLLYVYQRPLLLPLLPHGTDPYELNCLNDFPSLSGNQTPIRRNNRRNSLPTTPSSSQPNTTTTEPPVHTPISTTPTASVSTSTTTVTHSSSPVQTPISTTPTAIVSTSTTTTTHGSSPVQTPISTTTANISTGTTTTVHGSSPSVAGLDIVTRTPDLSSASDGLDDTMTQKPQDLSSASDGLETATQKPEDLSSASDGLEAVTPKPEDLSSAADGLEAVTPKPEDLSSSAGVGLQTMPINREWSPSDDGYPTFTQDQTDFMEAENRVFPDNVFGSYKYKKRMSAFKLAEAGLYIVEEKTSP